MSDLLRPPTALAVATGCLFALLTTGPAAAQLAAPELGAVNKWVCSVTGSQPKSYVTTVIGVADGMLYLEDQTDREFGRVEKPVQLYGLNLYNRRVLPGDKGELEQDFDLADFAGYRDMVPGTSFSADVGETNGNDTWTWRYSVEIGEPEVVVNDVLGEVTVLPVSEERWVYRENVGTSYKFKIVPETAQIVSWSYRSAKGKQDCELYLSYKKTIRDPVQPPVEEAAEDSAAEAAPDAGAEPASE